MEEKYSKEFLKTSHKGSFKNKKELLGSQICGCFYCENTFFPIEIFLKATIDENSPILVFDPTVKTCLFFVDSFCITFIIIS